ncbi:hypothetical protein M3Y99_01998600 [Aphelenchoides fujianensis]|nr:hypothetical protein M3Y99_01998600 [Aphelenchoides fujianensis]
MDIGSDDFRRTACLLIMGSTESQSELASSLKRLVQREFFVGEEVVLTATEGRARFHPFPLMNCRDYKKLAGTVIKALRDESHSKNENEIKYNVQFGDKIIHALAHFQLERKEKLDQSDLFSFITSVARKPTASSPWVLRDEVVQKWCMQHNEDKEKENREANKTIACVLGLLITLGYGGYSMWTDWQNWKRYHGY